MRALVLSGGGSKGAYQIGALKHLLIDQQREYDILVGVSVGALNAAFLAMHPDQQKAFHKLEMLWEGLDDSRVYKPWHGGKLWHLPALWKTSIFNTEPLRDIISRHLCPQSISESGKHLAVGAVSLTTGEFCVWDEHSPSIREAVLASSAYPIAFPPVKVDGEYYIDGGVRRLIPVRTALKMGATEIDIVVCSPTKVMESLTKKFHTLLVGLRALDVMFLEIMHNDLIHVDSDDIKVRMMQPDSFLMPSSLKFDPERMKEIKEIGYQQAKEVFK